MKTKCDLADVAKAEARKFYHGNVMAAATNLHPIAGLFPSSAGWNIDSWDNCWCAAFVYWCCVKAGYELPVRYDSEAVSCNFAGCVAWEEWAKLPEINCWVPKTESPKIGDIVIFDRVSRDAENDHIGIVVDVRDGFIETAEGNFNNVSAIVKRTRGNERGYVRLR